MEKNRIESAQRSDIGKKRTNNEDDFVFKKVPEQSSLLLLGAIDGVGGYEGGEKATEITKKIVEDYFVQHIDQIIQTPEQQIKKALILANNEIFHERKKNTDWHRMSCVASIAVLDKDSERLYFAHVGDSRGYVLRKQELIKFTKDHSLVGYLEEIGEITEQEAMNHPRRNEISKLLGEAELKLDDSYILSGTHTFYPRDIVLFCSDGLTDLVDKNSIIETLSKNISLEEKKEELIRKANDLGGKDNITVALATYSGNYPTEEKTHIIPKDKLKTQILPIDQKEQKAEQPLQAKNTQKKGTKNRLQFLLAFIIMALFVVGFLFKDKILPPTPPTTIDTTLTDTTKTEEQPLLPKYDYKSKLTDKFSIVQKDNLFGLIDLKDSVIIPLKYDNIEYFQKSLLKVKKGDKYGLITLEDSIVLPLEFSEINIYNKDTVYVKMDSLWSYYPIKSINDTTKAQ